MSKRNRSDRSSSFSEIVVPDRIPLPPAIDRPLDLGLRLALPETFGPPKPPLSPAKAPKSSAGDSIRSRIGLGIFDVSPSRETEKASDSDAGLASFLKYCHYCKKRNSKENICMFGDLRGFCSPECRERQFEIESKAGKLTELFVDEKPLKLSQIVNQCSLQQNE